VSVEIWTGRLPDTSASLQGSSYCCWMRTEHRHVSVGRAVFATTVRHSVSLVSDVRIFMRLPLSPDLLYAAVHHLLAVVRLSTRIPFWQNKCCRKYGFLVIELSYNWKFRYRFHWSLQYEISSQRLKHLLIFPLFLFIWWSLLLVHFRGNVTLLTDLS
jgi:hypothetical protein